MADGASASPALTNYSDTPLVTVQLMACAKDFHFVHRALASLAAQTLPHDQMEVQLLYDGTPSAEAEQTLEAAAHRSGLPWINFHPCRETGYYTVARNEALPATWGHYIQHMDVDNEFRPDHLRGLLEAIRVPHPDEGWPSFVYSRRLYVIDDDQPNKDLPTGESPLVEWTKESVNKLVLSPQNNFIDTGDFLISKGALYELAERSGCVWNSELRRFGDWDIVSRLAKYGFRGRAVDQVTNIYRWSKGNLQTTRRVSDVMHIPTDVYETLKAQGKVRG